LFENIKDHVARSAGPLFRCEETGSVLTIATPFTYPDGDEIELYLEKRGGDLILSDMGETLRSLGEKANPSAVEKITQNCHLLFRRGELLAVIRHEERLVDAILSLCQAILMISGLLFSNKFNKEGSR